MKRLGYYEKKGLGTIDEVFQYFYNTLLPENRTWDYFVNWDKVLSNINKFKIELNILNSLCNSKNFDVELEIILRRYPEVVNVLPILIGVRENKIDILDVDLLPEFVFKKHNFKVRNHLIESEIYDFIQFFQKSGLKRMIVEGGLVNLIDYSYGVEVGLDSNGRKNRGGTIMEDIVYKILKEVYHLSDNELITQSNSHVIQNKWGITIPVYKSDRRPDFVIFKNDKLHWIETNFYSGGGTKLKSTSGEYKKLFEFCDSNNINFIWITDGNGWKTAPLPLKETFMETNYIFNLSMVKDGILNEII